MKRDLPFYTLDDFELDGKSVLVRIDINSPINPLTMEILDDRRFRSHLSTLRELECSKVVLLAHQSRPGKADFTTLESHARLLSKLLRREVRYVDDIFGSHARREIENMSDGDIILLENVRFYSEEVEKSITSDKTFEKQSRTIMVRKLAPLFDLFVNDAFAAAHRSQPSIVGFPMVLPSAAGRLMEREYRVLRSLLEDLDRPSVYVLGGAKPEDPIKLMKNILPKGLADKVLLTGLIANIFLLAKGINLGDKIIEEMERKDLLDFLDDAKELLEKFEDKIELPVDLAINKDGERVEISVKDLPTNYPIYDIGMETIEKYSRIIMEAGTVVMNGPAGVFELEEFRIGTIELLRALSMCGGKTVIGGGHLVAAAEMAGVVDRITHVSTGGGALISFLSGEELPGIKALEISARRFAPR